jgi:hypothetical protein
MKTKQLISEIHRIKEIMGVSENKTLLKESVGDEIVDILLKFLKKDADELTRLGVKNADELKKIADKLTDSAITTIDKAAALKLIIDDLGDTAIKNIAKGAVNDTTNVIGRQIDSTIDDLMDLYRKETMTYDQVIDEINSQLDNFIKSTSDVKKLKAAITDEAAEKLKKTLSNEPKPLIPKKTLPKFTPDTPESTFDDVLAKYRNNPRAFPGFASYEPEVKNLGFSPRVEKAILAGYERYMDLGTAQLIDIGMEITGKFNEKEWGWLKKIFRDVNTEQIKTKNVVKLTALVVIISVIIPWGLTAVQFSNKTRKRFREWVGLDEPGYENTENDYVRWTQDNKLGYGIDAGYYWEDTATYRDANGNWQDMPYDEDNKTFGVKK